MKFTQTILVTLVVLGITLFACNKQEPTQPETTNVAAKGKPDKTKPVVTITSPTNGTFITPGQDFTVTADASDNIGIRKVGFTFNGNYKMMTVGPWVATYTMPTFVTAGMTMWVSVEAVDVNGNSGFNNIYLNVGQP